MYYYNGNLTINLYEHPDVVAALTPAWFHFTVGLVLLLATIASIVTNGIVLYVFLIKDRRQLTRTNIYITVICILAMIMAVLGVPMVVISSFSKKWIFGDIGCKYYAFLMSSCGLMTILILTAISIDRYIYVLHSDRSNSRLRKRPSVVCTLISAGIALSISLQPFFGWNKYTYEGVGTACAVDLVGKNNNGRSYILTLLICFLFVPFTVMTFCYGTVFVKVLKQSRGHLRSLHRAAHVRQNMRKLQMEHKLAITVILIIGLFILCWSPYGILLLWKLFNVDVEINPMIMSLPALMTKVGGAFTPLVYIARFKELRNQAIACLSCKKQRSTVHPTNIPMQKKTKKEEPSVVILSLKNSNKHIEASISSTNSIKYQARY